MLVKTRLRLFVFGLCLSLCVAFLASCGSGSNEASDPSEIFILGVSSLEWSRLDALMDQGKLPNFSKIVKGGTRADPQGEDPLAVAALWASIQSGKRDAKHQVYGNFEPMQNGLVCPARSVSRLTTSIWQMLSRNGHSVALVGLPVSFPAEVVRGQVVSNMAFPNRWSETSEVSFHPQEGQRETYPNALFQELKKLYRPADSISREELTRFFVLNEKEFSMAYDEPLGSIQHLDNPLRDFALTHQTDLSYLDMALYLKEHYHPELTACLLELPAVVSPPYWYFVQPEGLIAQSPNYRRFRDTVNETYRWIDERLGTVLDALDRNATLIVVSERGFGIEHVQNAEGETVPLAQAKPNGVLILYGHGIAKGKRLSFTKVYDLAPTILSMENTPIGDDLDGTPLTAAFTETFAAAHKPRYRKSYDLDKLEDARYETIESKKSQ
ncbi:MAG TPA: alkaline phosphatase family protein [Candidatus Krumholzibacteria bacterium]|nr:alkaline phosphatase family protein [Candidatus Krumholzibacteria bacterium]